MTPLITRTRIKANRGSPTARIGCAWSKGSNEITTVCRFATAKTTNMIPNGTRISPEMTLRIMRPRSSSHPHLVCGGSDVRNASGRISPRLRRFGGPIQTLAHFLAGLEERHRLLFDRDVRASARVAAHARRTVLHREGAEAPQLDAVASRHGGNDLPEDGVDDVLHVTLIEVRILRSNALHQLGLDHRDAHPLWRVAGFGPGMKGLIPTARSRAEANSQT